MKRVKIADLKNNLSRHLAHVRDGGELIVLDRDTPVARVIPFEPRATGRARADVDFNRSRLNDLERQGLIARGDARAMAGWLKDTRPRVLPKDSPSVVDLLLRIRRESRR